MKPPFHDPLTEFAPELDKSLYETGLRLAQAAEEMTPYGEKIAYSGELVIDCECATCAISSECPCPACTRVFGANKAHRGNGK